MKKRAALSVFSARLSARPNTLASLSSSPIFSTTSAISARRQEIRGVQFRNNQTATNPDKQQSEELNVSKIRRPPNIFIQLTQEKIPIIVREPSRELNTANLKYSLQDLPPSPHPSGYLPPLGNTEHLPFRFKRTDTERFPVYRKLKNGRSREVTLLRSFRGDVDELEAELYRLLGQDAVIKRHAGSFEIKGDHRWTLTMWLKRLGF